ncbi:FHA domain-containing protein [Agromyces protaetiae]|uniref:FHA domain-containing protein n=1 Tax=Agromyces protaetiae TaxID=2509455 RepID=A0A4P6F8Q1_9MICO|nr:RDD family protein [Agromyces protaetiae]QAY72134.1 FHA domain-containing protein [Agromyces protaetiae]
MSEYGVSRGAYPQTNTPQYGRPPVPAAPNGHQRRQLDPSFAGTPAGAGRRILAFTVDALVVAFVALAVYLPTSSIVYTAVAAIQVVLAGWVLEARTGLTVGNALLGLRTSRDDRPYSPGAGRAFARGFITALGGLWAVVGAWVVVASSAWDASGLRRSWADRAAQTVVVAVPARRSRTAPAAVRPPAAIPAVPLAARPYGAPAPVAQHYGAPAPVAQQYPVPVPVPVPVPQGQPYGVPTQAPAGVPVRAAAPTPRADHGLDEGGALLLVFDTGQRVRLPIPVAANLGRAPAATEPGDRIVSVEDHESTVSKTHARLEHSRGRTWITDGGSTNGSEVLSEDGVRTQLAPGVRHLLDDGDRVRLGNRTFTISVLMGADPAGEHH